MTGTVLQNPKTRNVVTLHAPQRRQGRDAVVFTTLLPAGAAGCPPHLHAHLTEMFEVLEGCVTFRIGRTERVVAAGQTVTVRPNKVHGFHNASAAPALVRCTVIPGAGFERLLRGMQPAAEAGRSMAAGLPRDPRRLARLLLDADFHFPGLPMALQRTVFRLFAALAPATPF